MLKEQPQVQKQKIAIYGASRGAEQAMIMACLAMKCGDVLKPNAIALHAPSDVIVPGWSWEWVHPRCPIPRDPTAQAWRWRGSYEGLEAGTRIAIEQFDQPIFISHGESDDLWEVDRSKRLEVILKQNNRIAEVLYLSGEGHILSNKAENIRRAKLLDFFCCYL